MNNRILALGQVCGIVRGWLDGLDFGGVTEVLRNDEEGLWVNFETANYLAELLVCRSEWGPFRYVSLRILDVRLPLEHGPVYVCFDDENSTEEDIRAGLTAGMEIMRR